MRFKINASRNTYSTNVCSPILQMDSSAQEHISSEQLPEGIQIWVFRLGERGGPLPSVSMWGGNEIPRAEESCLEV